MFASGATPEWTLHDGIDLLHEVVLTDAHVTCGTCVILRAGHNPTDCWELSGLHVLDEAGFLPQMLPVGSLWIDRNR